MLPAAKRFRIITRIYDKVYMIGHQAICVNSATKLLFEMDEMFPVIVVVVVRNKDALPVMATLDYMMRCMGKKYT